MCLLLLFDEGDVEVRVQEDGRGHEQGQRADQRQDQQRLKRDRKMDDVSAYSLRTLSTDPRDPCAI